MKATKIYEMPALTPAQMEQVADELSHGAVAVFATDTVYGLGTGAFCESAVQEIYRLKNRPTQRPLLLLVADMEQAQYVGQFSPQAKRLAQAYWPGGITLIVPPSETGEPLLRQATGLGLRVPALAALQHILRKMTMPLASTSANVHGQPVLTRAEEVVDSFTGQVDLILTQGTLTPTASSVVDCTQDPLQVVREGSISTQNIMRTAGTVRR